MAEDAKPLVVGVPKETFPGERRVALIPSMVRSLTKAGLDVIFETGAGLQAGFADEAYTAEGAKTIATRAEGFGAANVVLQVRTCGANATVWNADCELLREGQSLIGLCEPLAEAETMQTPWPAITQGFIGTIAVWFILGLVTIAHKLGSGPDAASKSLL